MTTVEHGFGAFAGPPTGSAPGSAGIEPVLPKRAPSILAALTVFSTAVFGLCTSFEIGHWTAPQITLIGTELAAFWAFVTAVVAHRAKSTKDQPVALAGTVTALLTATLSLAAGFRWWHFTEAQNAAVTGMLTALIAVVSALVARHFVRPTPRTDGPVDRDPSAGPSH
ncbi:hypothetical protein AAFP30_14120 [Gordonia sp. CPCC 205515]|uniref:hypothetical protein n=1 Tax=Gordonia sp. CPCC 205515 TaxID=3140791 RepID=UPI003AF3E798